MYLSSKYEEIYAPELKDFIHITDSTYSKKELLHLEGKVVQALNFNFTLPSALTFFERFWRVKEMQDKPRYLAMYLLDLTLLDFKMIKYIPSMLAASAVYLANKLYA